MSNSEKKIQATDTRSSKMTIGDIESTIITKAVQLLKLGKETYLMELIGEMDRMMNKGKTILTIGYPVNQKGKSEWNKRYGLNAYYSGKHWTARKQDAEYWHMLVAASLSQQRIPHQPYESPVRITYYFNNHLDLSNNAGYVKLIEDALKGWVIKDDSREWVQEIIYKWHDENYIKVVIQEL